MAIDKEKYIETGGVRCLHCRSEYIETWGNFYLSGGFEVSQRVVCNSCGKKWTDVYTLTDVEED